MQIFIFYPACIAGVDKYNERLIISEKKKVESETGCYKIRYVRIVLNMEIIAMSS